MTSTHPMCTLTRAYPVSVSSAEETSHGRQPRMLDLDCEDCRLGGYGSSQRYSGIWGYNTFPWPVIAAAPSTALTCCYITSKSFTRSGPILPPERRGSYRHIWA